MADIIIQQYAYQAEIDRMGNAAKVQAEEEARSSDQSSIDSDSPRRHGQHGNRHMQGQEEPLMSPTAAEAKNAYLHGYNARKRAALHAGKPGGNAVKSRQVALWINTTSKSEPAPARAAGATGHVPDELANRAAAAAGAAGLIPAPKQQPGLARSTTGLRMAHRSWWHKFKTTMASIFDRLPILHPDSPQKLTFDIALLVLVLYNAFVVPIDVSYGMPDWPERDYAEYGIDVLFAVDLFINFRTAYWSHQGELVRDAKLISKRYVSFWFWIDLVATIPFDLLIRAAAGSSSASLTALGFLKTPRLLRLARLLRFIDRFQNAKILKIGSLFLVMVMLAHWLACIWYGLLRYGGSSMHDEDWSFDVTLAYYDKKDAAAAAMAALAGAGLDSNGTVGNSSSTGDGNSTRHRSLLGFARQLHGLGTPLVESEASVGAYEASPPSLLSIYIVNYYNSFLLLVGDNMRAYNNVERVFMILVLLGGTLLYSAVVGHMAVLVATLNTTLNRHTQRQYLLGDMLRYIQAPSHFQTRTQTMFEYLKVRGHPGPEGFDFLRELPPRAHADLHDFLHTAHLKKLPLFNGCEPAFLSACAARMRVMLALPSDPIFRIGDAGREMYVLRKGAVAVVSGRNEVMALLGPGEVFGELALVHGGARTASCVGLAFCDLAALDGVNLRHVMADFPLSARALEANALRRLAELAKAGAAARMLGLLDDDDDLWGADLDRGDPDSAYLGTAGPGVQPGTQPRGHRRSGRAVRRQVPGFEPPIPSGAAAGMRLARISDAGQVVPTLDLNHLQAIVEGGSARGAEGPEGDHGLGASKLSQAGSGESSPQVATAAAAATADIETGGWGGGGDGGSGGRQRAIPDPRAPPPSFSPEPSGPVGEGTEGPDSAASLESLVWPRPRPRPLDNSTVRRASGGRGSHALGEGVESPTRVTSFAVPPALSAGRGSNTAHDEADAGASPFHAHARRRDSTVLLLQMLQATPLMQLGGATLSPRGALRTVPGGGYRQFPPTAGSAQHPSALRAAQRRSGDIASSLHSAGASTHLSTAPDTPLLPSVAPGAGDSAQGGEGDGVGPEHILLSPGGWARSKVSRAAPAVVVPAAGPQPKTLSPRDPSSVLRLDNAPRASVSGSGAPPPNLVAGAPAVGTGKGQAAAQVAPGNQGAQGGPPQARDAPPPALRQARKRSSDGAWGGVTMGLQGGGCSLAVEQLSKENRDLVARCERLRVQRDELLSLLHVLSSSLYRVEYNADQVAANLGVADGRLAALEQRLLAQAIGRSAVLDAAHTKLSASQIVSRAAMLEAEAAAGAAAAGITLARVGRAPSMLNLMGGGGGGSSKNPMSVSMNGNRPGTAKARAQGAVRAVSMAVRMGGGSGVSRSGSPEKAALNHAAPSFGRGSLVAARGSSNNLVAQDTPPPAAASPVAKGVGGGGGSQTGPLEPSGSAGTSQGARGADGFMGGSFQSPLKSALKR